LVLDKNEGKSQNSELADDILSIILVYSCRQMGRRRYSKVKRFYPKTEQKKILKQWMGTRRFVYNKVLGKIKSGEKINAIELRNKYVTYKTRSGIINPEVDEWQNEVPSDIREEAIRDLVKNHKTAFSNIENRNITGFKMNFCSKKDNPSMAIPLSAIGATNLEIEKTQEELNRVKTTKNKAKVRKKVEITRDNNGFSMYPRYLPGKLKIKKRQLRKKITIDGTCRIKFENNAWYLIAPYRR